MRINTLPQTNFLIQGPARRDWLREHAPQHLQQCKAIITRALTDRASGTSRSTLVLGAGGCTEVPLVDLVRSSDDVVLADIDVGAMERARNELSAANFRKRVRLVNCDLTGGVSANIDKLLHKQDWTQHVAAGSKAVFDAAADCLEQCHVPNPPQIHTLQSGEYGLVVSTLVLSQLFSYPILDILDRVQKVAPAMLGEQERHRHYQEAAQAFRIRIIKAHLNYMRTLLDRDGVAVLLTDVRGFAFFVHGTDHDATHRRYLPLVPRIFPELVSSAFTIVEEGQWDWIADLPEKDRPGRGYEIAGYILRASTTE